MSWTESFDRIRAAGHRIDPGLTAAELAAAEAHCAARFPPDLADLLRTGVPRDDAGRFSDWRTLEGVDDRLIWPLEGFWFDIEHNAYWRDDWGPRPADVEDAWSIASAIISAAPILLPLYSHRFLPADPLLPGNPIFSVHQTDIIYYGADLASYIAAEFGGGWAPSPEIRAIRFWSDVAS